MQTLTTRSAYASIEKWGRVRPPDRAGSRRTRTPRIAAANDAAERIAAKTGGIAQSSIAEALANVPATAHILGGAVIGRDYHSGVIDRDVIAYAHELLGR